MKAQISHGFLCAAQAAQAAKGGSMTVYLVNILYLVLFLVLYWKDRRRMANGFLFFILLVLSGASLLRLAQDTQSEFLYFVVFAVGILVALCCAESAGYRQTFSAFRWGWGLCCGWC